MLESAVRRSVTSAFDLNLIQRVVDAAVRPWAAVLPLVSRPELTSAAARKAYLLLGEVVFDQTAHDLLRGPGCADMRGD